MDKRIYNADGIEVNSVVRFDHVRIKLDNWNKGTVEVNGQPLKSSIGVKVEALKPGLPPRVTFVLMADVDIEVDAIVDIQGGD